VPLRNTFFGRTIAKPIVHPAYREIIVEKHVESPPMLIAKLEKAQVCRASRRWYTQRHRLWVAFISDTLRIDRTHPSWMRWVEDLPHDASWRAAKPKDACRETSCSQPVSSAAIRYDLSCRGRMNSTVRIGRDEIEGAGVLSKERHHRSGSRRWSYVNGKGFVRRTSTHPGYRRVTVRW